MSEQLLEQQTEQLDPELILPAPVGDAVDAPIENSVDQATEEDPVTSKVASLQRIIDDIADGDGALADESREYLRNGGSITTALAEIEGLRSDSPSDAELALKEARSGYAGAMARHGRRGRREVESNYQQALTERLKESTTTGDRTEAEARNLEDLSARELAAVTQTILAERERLKEQLEQSKAERISGRIIRSRVIRTAVLGSVVSAALSAKFGLLPSEGWDKNLEIGLNMTTAYLFSTKAESAALNVGSNLLERRREKQIGKLPAEIGKLVTATAEAATTNGPAPTPERLQEAKRFAAETLFGTHLEDLKQITQELDQNPEALSLILEKVVSSEVQRAKQEASRSRKRARLVKALAFGASLGTGGMALSTAEAYIEAKDAQESLEATLSAV